jgi:segregation and condensation protein A
MAYEVNLDLFKGPLDLLLYLVRKAEIDIKDIEVCRITDQYLEHLELMKALDLDVAGEFIVMAAILMRLKARELLPQEEREALEQEEDFIDREKLIAQLQEHERFKQAAAGLRRREEENFGAFYRAAREPVVYTADDYLGRQDVEIYDLMLAFKKIVDEAKKSPSYFMAADNVTIDDRIERVVSVVTEKKRVPFAELFADDQRKIVIVVTFMAILELSKMGIIAFTQETHLDEITVFETDPEEQELFFAAPESAPTPS